MNSGVRSHCMRLAKVMVALLLGSMSAAGMAPHVTGGPQAVTAALPNGSVTLRLGQTEVSSVDVSVGDHVATASLSGCGVERSILVDSIRVELRMLGPAEDIHDLWVFFDVRAGARAGESSTGRISLRWIDEEFMYARRTVTTLHESISEPLC